MINGRPAVENDRGMVQNIDPGCPEILRLDTFYMDKLVKLQIDLVFVSHLGIRGFFSGRLRLGDKYSLNLQDVATFSDTEKVILTILPLWILSPTTREEFQGYKGIKSYRITKYVWISTIPIHGR